MKTVRGFHLFKSHFHLWHWEFLTDMNINIHVFQDVTSCSLVTIYQHFIFYSLIETP